jgi:dipeptidyl aminopeptidase/acylaminoacyl peptidase
MQLYMTNRMLLFFCCFIATAQLSFHIYAQDDILSWKPQYMVGLDMADVSIVSADGQWVGYLVRSAKTEGEDSKFTSQLWVTSLVSDFNRQYTYESEGINGLQFSPDSRSISFLSKKDGKIQIFVMPVDGGSYYPISKSESNISSYQWMPDGKSIIYAAADTETDEEKKDKKEKRDVILIDKQYKYNRLYRLDTESRKVKLLFDENIHVIDFDISPDGTQIAFSYQPTPRINDRYKSELAMVSSDSGKVVQLVNREGVDTKALFTRDGSEVVFGSSGGKHEPIGLMDIYAVRKANKQIRSFARTHDRSVNLIGLDAEDKIIYTESQGTQSHIFSMPLKGGNFTRISSAPGVHSRVSLNSTGTHISYCFEDSEVFREVYAGTISNHKPVKVSSVGTEVKLPKMGKTEVLTWKSKDGTAIEGLITYPVGYEPGKRVPLILMVHGGPAGVYSQNWTGGGSIYCIQYFAEKGYALLRPNPRGSTGYGKDFRYANFRDWGFGDYEDLMAGVDYVIEMGVADQNNLFEMGWSYGGYMTSWIVTQTKRFNAVSMGAGLSNLVSMTGTTDIPDYLTGHMGGPYTGENWDTYQKQSAIYYVDQVQTPTQIIHGKEDLRVPIAQAQEFYYALSERNIPTEMIVYPRTPHGPIEPKFLADVSERIMLWFEKYRK